jgi:hypothetical protein
MVERLCTSTHSCYETEDQNMVTYNLTTILKYRNYFLRDVPQDQEKYSHLSQNTCISYSFLEKIFFSAKDEVVSYLL